jgi:hypothetical protein
MVVAGFATQIERRDEFCQESRKLRAHGSGHKCSRRETFRVPIYNEEIHLLRIVNIALNQEIFLLSPITR